LQSTAGQEQYRSSITYLIIIKVYLADTYKWDAPIIAVTIKINKENIPKSKLMGLLI
jgi:hypothetical protein